MKIVVQGLWHLGSVTAACLAAVGHEVIGLDPDESNLLPLRAGRAPILEPGLDALIAGGVATGGLRFVGNPSEVPADAELLWVAFDTPVNEDDEADVAFVIAQIHAVLPFVAPGATVLISSQVPVGTVKLLESHANALYPDKKLGFAYSPENLRLGKALDVFQHPDRVVVGVRTQVDRLRIAQMLRPITERIEWMTVESAEMTKHALNAFLATSVAFANEIAVLCEQVGADAKEVERGLKSEQRIGPRAYLSPGGAFAGGTLARDVEFLRSIGERSDLRCDLLRSIKVSNDFHRGWPLRTLVALLDRIDGVRIAVWGLTYKPGTDTLRRSASVELCKALLEMGADLAVHDPVAQSLPDGLAGRIRRADAPLSALSGAVALVVATEWPEYRKVEPTASLVGPKGLVIVDANRFLANWAGLTGVRYSAVGAPMFRGTS